MTTDRIVACPDHTREAFDISTMPLIVRWAEEICYKRRIDAIVASGHSGLVIAGALAYATRIPVFAVRKAGELKHCVAYTAGPVSAVAPNGKAKRWAWFDDFLSSGGTFRNAVATLHEARLVEHPWPEAIIEYRQHWQGKPSEPAGRWELDWLQLDQHRFPTIDWTGAPETIDVYQRPE